MSFKRSVNKKWFSRQEALRILVLIGTLFLVLFMMYKFMPRKTLPGERPIGIHQESNSKPGNLSEIVPAGKNVSKPTGVVNPKNGEHISPSSSEPLNLKLGLLDPDPPQPGRPADYDKVIATIKDSVGQKELPFEQKPLSYLFQTVRITSPEDPARKNCPFLSGRDFEKNPAKLRGKWVKVIGSVNGDFYQPERLKESGPSGVYLMYLNFLFDSTASLIKVYSVTNKPFLGKGDVVVAEGVFFKLDSYEARNKKWVTVPVVIVNKLEMYIPPTSETSQWYYVLIAFSVILTVVVSVLLIIGGTKGIGYKKKKDGNRGKRRADKS